MRLYFSILCIVLGFSLQAQKYGLVTDPMCWQVNGQDSSITRLVQISTLSGEGRVVSYFNSDGNQINVLGGNLRFGYCECCDHDSTNVAIVATVLIETLTTPVADPFNPNYCGSTLIASTTGVTNQSQITVTLDGAPVSFIFNQATGEVTSHFNSTTGTGIHTVVVSISTPYGTDSDNAQFDCG